MIIFLLFLFLVFLAVLILLFLAYSGFAVFDLILPAPFVATKSEVVKKMIKIANIKKGSRVFDLGSGDGKLVIEAAKLGATAVGIEKNPFLVVFSRFKVRLASLPAKIYYQDIFQADLRTADIVLIYLNLKVLTKLKNKLEKELKVGAKVVSNTYEIPGWKFAKKSDNIFVYIIDEKH